eukprot:1742764-Prymnesium_polylepis.1
MAAAHHCRLYGCSAQQPGAGVPALRVVGAPPPVPWPPLFSDELSGRAVAAPATPIGGRNSELMPVHSPVLPAVVGDRALAVDQHRLANASVPPWDAGDGLRELAHRERLAAERWAAAGRPRRLL